MDLASILVGDQTEFFITISFWGDKAELVNKLSVGDIVILTNIAFTVTNNRKVGKATESSCLYNFRHSGNELLDYNKTGMCSQDNLFKAKYYILVNKSC